MKALFPHVSAEEWQAAEARVAAIGSNRPRPKLYQIEPPKPPSAYRLQAIERGNAQLYLRKRPKGWPEFEALPDEVRQLPYIQFVMRLKGEIPGN